VLIDPAIIKTMFPGTGVYSKPGGLAASLWANVQENAVRFGMDDSLVQLVSMGLARVAAGRMDKAEMAEIGLIPVRGDALEADGTTWRVESARIEGGLWLMLLVSGFMDTPVIIQSQGSRTPNSRGGFSDAWNTLDTVQGEVWSLSGQERAAQSGTQASVTHRVRIPAFPGLSTAHRLLVGGKSLGITYVNDIHQRGQVMLVDCLEIVGRQSL